MIVRIVKMEFKLQKVDEFITLFEDRKMKIRNFPGCQYLELLRGEAAFGNIFITYSHWDSEDHLNNYRNSDLFDETWELTKSLFSKKAEAISLEKIVVLD